MFALHVLASGSKGNATIVEDTTTHRGVLVDCGICKRDFMTRSAEAGFDPSNLDAILITHDHSDHTKGLGVVARALCKSGAQPPVYVLPAVRRASKEIAAIEDTLPIAEMASQQAFAVNTITVHTFPTSHDAADSCGFRFESADGDTLGYVTDTGILGEEARALLCGVRILALESNHDVDMLARGEYPFYLKQRIASALGHLSNEQAKCALADLAHEGLEHVIAMHLSENNNMPPYARQALEGALATAQCPAKVSIASQYMLVSVR